MSDFYLNFVVTKDALMTDNLDHVYYLRLRNL